MPKGLATAPPLPPPPQALRPLACPGRRLTVWAAAQTSKGALTNNKPQFCCACGGNAFWSPGISSENHLCLLASCLAWVFGTRAPAFQPAGGWESEGRERAKGAVVSLRGCKFQPVPLRPLLGSGSPVALGQVKFVLSVIGTDGSFLKDRDREPALSLLT